MKPEALPSIKLLEENDSKILDWYVAEYTKQGWRVLNRSEAGVQFQKPKEWSALGTLLFILLPALGACLWISMLGVALIGLVLVAAHYLMQQDKLEYISASQARDSVKELLGVMQSA